MNTSSVKFITAFITNLIWVGFLILPLLISTNCSSKQKPMQDAATATSLITYKKERSRGNRLPLYTIEILDNGMARYTGTANVPFIGERLIELDKKEYQAIVDQFKAASFSDFETSYKGKLRDIPLTSITYGGHKVTYQEMACPKNLRQLVALVEGVVEK